VPKLFSAREVIRALRRAGFHQVSQRGSHIKLKKAIEGGELVVIVPNYREIPKGTLESILLQARLTSEQLEELL
jgi:predicted RNA binding protein YcfA (HicA-like mRNA interferase family)